MPSPVLRLLTAPLPLVALALSLATTPARAAAVADDDEEEEATPAPGQGTGGGMRVLNGPAISATGRFTVVAGGGTSFRPVERRDPDAPETPAATRSGLAREKQVTVVRPVLAAPAQPAPKAGQPPRNGGPPPAAMPPGATGERPR